MDLSFLKSTRFWFVVIIALGQSVQNYASTNDFIGSLVQFITILGGGSVGIRTIDRFGEKVGENK